jgi:hypothetical protein
VKQLNIGDLNKLYQDAEDSDREVFAEQRSNILLIAGDHYNKRTSQLYSRLKETTKDVNSNQRLRLTKNHIHKLYRNYVSNILSYAPGVTILPQKDLEIQDQKDADLNKAVWEDAKYRYRLNEKIRRFAGDFVGIGEVACKVFYDPNAGDVKGYEALVEMDDMGNPVVDEMGQVIPVLDESGQPQKDPERPVFQGAFVFERLFGFNLLREAGAKSMDESKFLIIRKMVDIAHLKAMYKEDEQKLKMLATSNDETYVVFDSNRGEYGKSKDQVLVKEYYWKPCYSYPNGYFAITTADGILEEGELPFGIFPIIYQGFDEYPTAPRGRSPVKQWRPFQAEINRAASAMATHQVTIGDDKILYQGGTKLSPGSLLPGVRGITFNGTVAPTILPGRDGSQYLPYIEAQVKELYDVAEMAEEAAEIPAQVDAYALLYSSMRQRRKFASYSEKFEQFLIDMAELYLELAKQYMPDDELVYAVGRSEIVNIAEFRKTTKLCYQIKIEPRSETVETQLGKQLSMNHILQYVGPQLGKDDIGKIIRNMPFSNTEESFRDFTIDYDVAKNDILALERGERPTANQYDNHEYLVQRVSARMKEPDFKFLSPEIQQNYQMYRQAHEQMMAEQAQKLIDAKNEFIPVSGAMIACDLYTPNPQDPSKAAKRVRLPYTALDWLVHQLEKQGTALDKLEHMNQGVVSEMAPMIGSQTNERSQSGMMAGSVPPHPMMPPANFGGVRGAGPTSPIGVS